MSRHLSLTTTHLLVPFEIKLIYQLHVVGIGKGACSSVVIDVSKINRGLPYKITPHYTTFGLHSYGFSVTSLFSMNFKHLRLSY